MGALLVADAFLIWLNIEGFSSGVDRQLASFAAALSFLVAVIFLGRSIWQSVADWRYKHRKTD